MNDISMMQWNVYSDFLKISAAVVISLSNKVYSLFVLLYTFYFSYL